MSGFGKSIIGPQGALAVNGSRVCFITSLVRDWSRARVTPNSFSAPAELPNGFRIACWMPDIWWGVNNCCCPSSPHPCQVLRTELTSGRAKISQQAWRPGLASHACEHRVVGSQRLSRPSPVLPPGLCTCCPLCWAPSTLTSAQLAPSCCLALISKVASSGSPSLITLLWSDLHCPALFLSSTYQ